MKLVEGEPRVTRRFPFPPLLTSRLSGHLQGPLMLIEPFSTMQDLSVELYDHLVLFLPAKSTQATCAQTCFRLFDMMSRSLEQEVFKSVVARHAIPSGGDGAAERVVVQVG